MTHREIADNLLTPIWRGIPEGYKKKYLRNIWQQFEDNIKSAAYTSTLSKFLSNITTRLGVALSEGDSETVTQLTLCGDDRIALKMLRDEATLLVLMVRVANGERKGKNASA